MSSHVKVTVHNSVGKYWNGSSIHNDPNGATAMALTTLMALAVGRQRNAVKGTVLTLATVETIPVQNKTLSYRRDSARCVKRTFKVNQGHPLLCQSQGRIKASAGPRCCAKCGLLTDL